MIKIHTDAAVKGQLGPAGLGVLIQKDGAQIPLKFVDLEPVDNHQAEFKAVIRALEYALEQEWQNEWIFLYTDSKIVADSLHKQYAGREAFQAFLTQVLTLSQSFQQLMIEWIPENLNKGADQLARQALKQVKK